MRGVFGAPHPKNYPICVLLTLPVKDFISDPGRAAEAEELIVENLKRFAFDRSDHVLIACNTAHILVPALQRRTGIKFESLIESTRQEIQRRNISRIGVLASPTSLERNVHELTGIDVVHPSNTARVGKLIREIVNGVTTADQLQILKSEIADMYRSGAEAILLGCAELEMLLANDHDSHFIRPLELTVKKMLETKDV